MSAVLLRASVQRCLVFTLCVLLASCGGGSGADSPDAVVVSPPPVIVTPPVTIPPVTGTPVDMGVMVAFGYNSLAAGAPMRFNQVQSSAVGNGAASYRFPRSGETISGNLTIAVDVTDPDGIARVLVGFNGSSEALVLCETNCGTSFSQTVTGVNPRNFGLTPGSLRLELWLEDQLNNRVLFDARDIEWLPEAITAVNTSRTGTTAEVNWAANSNASRYNLYIAEQPGITPENILSKTAGQQFLALTQTSLSVSGLNPTTRYFLLITGVDSSGESLFSEQHVIQPEGAPQFSSPVATADQFVLDEDTELSGVLLDNDSHPDARSFSLDTEAVRQPQNGVVQLNTDGSFAYVPAVNFVGDDSFIYQITDTEGLTAQALVSLTVTAVNDSPVALDDSFSLNKNTSLTLPAPGILANDTDIDGDKLVVDSAALTLPKHGQLQLSPDGAFSYTPDTNYTGDDAFVYQISDAQGAVAQAKVSLRIEMTNAAPLAQNDFYQVSEDEQLVVSAANGVLANDSDPDADSISLLTDLLSTVQNGQLIVSADGSFNYVPRQDFFGTDSFSYQIKDPSGLVSAATVEIKVLAQNDPPVVQAASYSVNSNQVLSVAAPGLLAYAFDVDDESLILSAQPVVAPAKGSLSLAADGSFSYSPYSQVSGSDSFTIKVLDSKGAFSTGTVVISIIYQASAPVLADASFEIFANAPAGFALAQLTAADTDPDDTASFSLLSGNDAGIFALSPSGLLTVADAEKLAQQSGSTQSLFIQVEDSYGLRDEATLLISIAAVPVVANPDSYTVAQGGTLTVSPGVLANDSGSASGALTATLVSGPSNGQLTLNQDGSFSYTPIASFYGTDSFIYQASNGVYSAEANVTLTVTYTAPELVAQFDSYTLDEDSTLVVSAANSLLQNDTFDATQPVSVSLVLAPVYGSLNLNADGTFSYQPVANIYGADSFKYRLTQGDLSVDGHVDLYIEAVNDSPELQDATVTISDDYVDLQPVLTLSQYDPDPGSYSYEILSGNSAGVFAVTADAVIKVLNSALLDADTTATYSLVVQVTENADSSLTDTATIVINVEEGNADLLASPDSYTLDEDTTLTVTSANSVLKNDTFDATQPVSVSLVLAPVYGSLNLNTDGTFSYQPVANIYGADSFKYRLMQGDLSVDGHVDLYIEAVNDSPELQDATVTISDDYVDLQPVLTLSQYDPDPGSYSYEILSGNSAGVFAVTSDAVIKVLNSALLDADTTATYSLVVQVTENADSSLTDTATIVINVEEGNADLLASPDSYTLNEDTTLTVTSANSVLQNDTFDTTQPVSVSLVQGPIYGFGTLSLNTDGTFSFQPHANSYGTDYFTYSLTQGNLTSEAQVELNIMPVNDPPVLQDATVTISDDYVDLQPVLTLSQYDPDPGSYSYEILSGNSAGVFAVTADAVIKVLNSALLDADTTATYSLVVQVTENADSSLTDTATIVINVEEGNADLLASPDSYTLDEDTTLTVTSANSVLKNDTFDTTQPVSVSLVQGPIYGFGTLSLNTDGTFSFQPNANSYGTDYFTYSLTQGNLTSEAQVELNIMPVNDPPVLQDATVTISDDYVDLQPVLTLSQYDQEQGSYSYEIESGDPNGVFAVTSDAVLKVANSALLNASTTPTYTLLIKVTENNDATLVDTATIVITVEAATADETIVNADTTFAAGGNLEIEMMLSGEYNDPVQIIPLSDGRSLVIGTINNSSNQEIFVLRLTADGSVDSSYADNGVFRNKQFSTSSSEQAVAAVMTSSNELVVLANYFESGTSGFYLIKLSDNGVLDSSFGSTLGYVLCTSTPCDSGNEQATDLILNHLGHYVVSGVKDGTAFLFEFADSGYQGGWHSTITAMTQFDLVRQDSLNNYYAIGPSDTGDIVVARLSSSFALDTASFGCDINNPSVCVGYKSHDFALMSSMAYDAVLYNDALYVVGSVTESSAPSSPDALFFKLAADGSLDTNFGVNSGFTQVYGQSDYPLHYHSLAVDSTGFYVLTSTEQSASLDLTSLSHYDLTGQFIADQPLAIDGQLKAVDLQLEGPALWLLQQFSNPNYGAVATVSFNWVAKYQTTDLTADTTFSADGKRWFNAGFGSDTIMGSRRLLLGSQVNQTLFYGYSYSYINGMYQQAFVGKLTASGVLDQSFGNHGLVLVADDQLSQMEVNAVLEGQADQLYVAGFGLDSSSNSVGFVLRLDQYGGLDSSFDGGVFDLIPNAFGNYSGSSALQLQLRADGHVLVGAEFSQTQDNYDIALIQLNTDGTLDTGTFGTSGSGFTLFTEIDTNSQTEERLSQMKVDPMDDSLVIAGQYKLTADPQLYVARFSSAGLLENSTNNPSAAFGDGGSGYAVVNIIDSSNDQTKYSEYLNDFDFDAAGNLILAIAKNYEGDEAHYLFRLQSDGLVSSSFNSGAPKLFDSFSDLTTVGIQIKSIEVDAQGRLLMAGTYGTYGEDAWIGRVLLDGSGTDVGRWDPAFEPGSATAGAYLLTGFSFSYDVFLELSGNRVTLGWSNSNASYTATMRQYQLYEYTPSPPG